MNRSKSHIRRILLGVFAAIELCVAGMSLYFILLAADASGTHHMTDGNLMKTMLFTWVAAAIMSIYAFFSERDWPRHVGIAAHALTVVLALLEFLHVRQAAVTSLRSQDSISGLGTILVAILIYLPLLLVIAVAALGVFLLLILPRPKAKES